VRRERGEVEGEGGKCEQGREGGGGDSDAACAVWDIASPRVLIRVDGPTPWGSRWAPRAHMRLRPLVIAQPLTRGRRVGGEEETIVERKKRGHRVSEKEERDSGNSMRPNRSMV